MQGRRIASNRVYASPNKAFTNYVVEINADGQYVKTYPLEGEQAATEWLGGITVITPLLFDDFKEITCIADFYTKGQMGLDSYVISMKLSATGKMSSDFKSVPMQVYHISGISSTSAEFRADNGRSNCHIERLTR